VVGIVTVVVLVGAVTVATPATPIQEHALEYAATPEHGLAYAGMVGLAARLLMMESGSIVTVAVAV
jgi:hypothetical protein